MDIFTFFLLFNLFCQFCIWKQMVNLSCKNACGYFRTGSKLKNSCQNWSQWNDKKQWLNVYRSMSYAYRRGSDYWKAYKTYLECFVINFKTVNMRTMDVCITFLIEATELSIETTWKLLYIISVYHSTMYDLKLCHKLITKHSRCVLYAFQLSKPLLYMT